MPKLSGHIGERYLTNTDKCGNDKEVEETATWQDFRSKYQDLKFWGKVEVEFQNGEPAFSRVIQETHQHKKS